MVCFGTWRSGGSPDPHVEEMLRSGAATVLERSDYDARDWYFKGRYGRWSKGAGCSDQKPRERGRIFFDHCLMNMPV